MRQPKYTGFVLIDDGNVLCPTCSNALRANGKPLCEGDTYGNDPCDVCGSLPRWFSNCLGYDIAEVGDTIASKQSGTTVTVMEHNLAYARFLIREGKYWEIVSKGD